MSPEFSKAIKVNIIKVNGDTSIAEYSDGRISPLTIKEQSSDSRKTIGVIGAGVASVALLLIASGILPPATEAQGSINMQDPATQARVHALAKIGVTNPSDIQIYLEKGILPDSISGVDKTVLKQGSFHQVAGIRGEFNNAIANLFNNPQSDAQMGAKWEAQVKPLRDLEQTLANLDQTPQAAPAKARTKIASR